MNGFTDSLKLVFWDAQLSQVQRWLFNHQLYAVVAGLILMSFIFPVHRWTKRTTIGMVHDYFYGVFHALVTFPVMVTSAFLLKTAIDEWTPWINLNLSKHLPITYQILLAIFFNDFLKYIAHYLSHKIRLLWHFHAIHHSQRELNPFTTKRTHIVESLFSNLCIGAVPLAIMGSPPKIWLAYFLISATWDYFIHSNLRISLGPLKYVFVSPLYHRLHHSCEREHADKNFGNNFVIWDILFGTADFDFSKNHGTGLIDSTIANEHSIHPHHIVRIFCAQWLYPFVMIYKDYKSSQLAQNTSA